MLVHKKLLLKFTLFLALSLLASNLFAESAYLSGFGNLYKLKLNRLSSSKHRFIGRISGLGTIKFRVIRKKNYNTTEKIFSGNRFQERKIKATFYEGTATILGKNLSFPVHFSVYKNKVKVAFNDTKTNNILKKHYSLNVSERNLISLRRSSFKGISGFCNVKSKKSDISSLRNYRNQTLRELKIGVVSDKEWYQDFKDDAGSEILRVVSEVETIYKNQLKIKFNIKENIVYKDRQFGGRNSDGDVIAKNMLFDFKDKIRKESFYANADNFHLFSAVKAINPDNSSQKIIGLAFTGVICKSKGSSFGFTTRSNTAGSEIPTFAHELGHSFNARHTDTGIMMGTFNPSNPQDKFSNISLLEIRNHINNYNSCLKEINGGGGSSSGGSGAGQVPIALNMQLSRKGSATITIDLDETYPDCELKIKASTKRRRITQGRIIYLGKAIFANTTLIARFRKRASGINLRTNNPIKYFLISELTCSNGISDESNIVRFKPNRIRSKKVLTASRWFTGFSRKIRNSVE